MTFVVKGASAKGREGVTLHPTHRTYWYCTHPGWLHFTKKMFVRARLGLCFGAVLFVCASAQTCALERTTGVVYGQSHFETPTLPSVDACCSALTENATRMKIHNQVHRKTVIVVWLTRVLMC
jgi:hypothetical protein